MAGRDPAFLFFTLDWLQLTAKLYPEEKGVFIDLLCHQHRDGFVVDDPVRLARTVGLTVEQFQPIWLTVRLMFDVREGNRLVNLWLEEKVTDRSTGKSTNSHVRSILSRFAVLVRKAKGVAPGIVEQIKTEFNIIDFQDFELSEATEKLTNWWTYRYNQLVQLGNQIGKPKNNLVIENENENDRLADDFGGEGGKEGERREPDWPAMPGPKECGLELPTAKAQSAKQLMILTGSSPTDEDVGQLWEIFKVQNFTGNKFYSSANEAFSHFINWSKSQKINGTSHANSSDGSLGTSAARIRGLQNW